VPPPTVFLPLDTALGAEVGIAARAGGPAAGLVSPVARALAAAVPGARVTEAETLEAALARHRAPLRWFAAVLAVLALAATLAAAGGVYGVMSFMVARRRREIGVRAALGATPWQLLQEVAGEGGRLAAAGAVVGSMGAVVVAGQLRESFHGVHSLDAATYLGVAATLAVVALVGSALPALRGARTDAAEALRAE
jgi:putative ABC transport system permease protein